MPDIPVELLHKIIRDGLFDDPAALSCISLLCRDIRNLGQQMLFRRFKIFVITQIDTASLVSRLEALATLPRLLSYVVDFELEVLTDQQYTGLAEWMGENGGLLKSVFEMIQLGEPLEVFTVSGQWGFRDWMRFHEDGRQFLDLLIQMASAPTIHTLDLIMMPATFLHRSYPSLKHLTTREMSRCPVTAFEEDIEASPPSVLTTLHVEGCSGGSQADWEVFEYLASHRSTQIRLNNLQELAFLCYLPGSWGYARTIIDKCRPSLIKLLVKCSELPSDTLPNLALVALPNLRHLTVMLNLKKEQPNTPPSHTSWLKSELVTDSLGLPLSLEKVIIIFIGRLVHGLPDGRLSTDDRQDLKEISQALSDQEWFPRLRSVEIHIAERQYSHHPDGVIRRPSFVNPIEADDGVDHEVREAAEALIERGVLKVEWECHYTNPWEWYH
ncbi:hypothetical protein BKA70DRAFT_1290920 [Coprinopsis sp. MPI-PUGE-AT-0042]|nr:hypothetical protein BKA70DRAFT_1290920 [Coprinopsis sp. MPI-PUGE-AT-0042]